MNSFGRWLLGVLLAGLALQLAFLLRIALMVVIAPESTAFMRSEAWRVAGRAVTSESRWRWSAQWVPRERISVNLQRAVIASEDASFVRHGGVDWQAIESAWKRNRHRQQQAQRPSRSDRKSTRLNSSH